MKKELPLSTPASFRYSANAWAAIRAAVIHLPYSARPLGDTDLVRQRFGPGATLMDMMRHWLELAAAKYLAYLDAQPRSLQNRAAICDRLLSDIDRVSDDVVEFVVATYGGQALFPEICADLDGVLEDLSDARQLFSEMRAALDPDHLLHYGLGFAPTAPARTVYQHTVLDVWLRLGGQLKISRHPLSGEVSGPLWRYFQSAAAPVMGSDMPSPASFPRLVSSYRKLTGDRANQVPAAINGHAGQDRAPH